MANVVNYEGVLATLSTAAAGTVTTANQKNLKGRGLLLYIDLGTVGGTTSIVVTVQGVNATTGTVFTLLASASLATGSTMTVLRVYPGLTAATNLVANDVLPTTWNVKYVVTGSNGITGTISAAVIM